MKKINIEIKKLGINGEGIGYYNKKPVFIPNALIGEEVEVEIIEDKNKFAYGKVLNYLKKSEDRVNHKCNISKCDACNLMHLNYAKQLEFKYNTLKESIEKYSDIDSFKISECVSSENIYGYRNSLKLPFTMSNNKLALGMYKSGTNYINEVRNCMVHEDGLEKVKVNILNVLNKYHLKAYDNKTKLGLRYLILRGFKGNYQVSFISGNNFLSKELINDLMKIEGLCSIWQSVNTSKNSVELFGKKMIHLAGKKKLGFNLNKRRLYVSPKSFFQLNTNQAIRLYDYVSDLISDNNSLIVEAYCGIGAMSIYNAHKAEKLIGIEYISDAISNANLNAKMNKINNIEFICGDAGKELVKISKKAMIDYLIVDPPRSGLDESMINCIMNSNIKNIIYVSCNPSTLSKNLNELKKRYEVDSIKPFDMFPNTSNVESVTLLKRK